MLDTPPPPLRILVLDGQDRQALAAVRSLGRHRNAVAVAAHVRHTPAFASRYCSERHQSPDPRAGRGGYVRWLVDNLQRGRFDALLCFDPATAEIVSEYRSTVRHYTGCALPPHQALLDLASPQRLLRQASSLGLGVTGLTAGSRWPGADQPSRSERFYLLTALMRAGEPVATFVQRELASHRPAHRRGRRQLFTRPWPAIDSWGAVSVEKPDVTRLGTELLRSLRWHGLATIAFRQDRRLGRLDWIGMHPGLVDGIELAIAAGVDLPWLYVQLAAGRPVTGPTRYRLGLKCVRLQPSRAFRDPVAYGMQTLARFGPDTCTDLCFRDPMPHLDALGRVVGRMRRTRAGAGSHADASVAPTGVIVPFPAGRAAGR